MRRVAVAALLAALGSSCGGEPSQEPASEAARKPDPKPDAAVQRAEELLAAPHGSFIQQVAVTDAGDAALSVDALGLIRLWPALDGRREPLVVRGGPARQVALGRGDGALVAALLDPAGGIEVLAFDDAGAVRDRTRVFHEPGYQEIAFSGGVLLARTTDHAIAAFDARGALRGKVVAEPGERITSLLVRGRAAAAAIAERETADAAARDERPGAISRAVRRIELDGGLRWGALLALPGSLRAPLAISPSGKRLAGFDAKSGMFLMLELEPKPQVAKDRNAFGAAMGIAFLDEETLASSDGSVLVFAGDEDQQRRRLRTGQGFPALADGLAVSGQGGSLVVSNLDETWFVGYRDPPNGMMRRAGDVVRLSSPFRVLWLDRRLQVLREEPVNQALARDFMIDETRSLERNFIQSKHGHEHGPTALVDRATRRRTPLSPDPGEVTAYEPRTQTIASIDRDLVKRWRLDLATGAITPGGIPLRVRRGWAVELFDPAEADGVVAVAYEDNFDYINVETFVEREPDPRKKVLAAAARTTLAAESLIGFDRRGTTWLLKRSKPKQVTAYRGGRVAARFPVADDMVSGNPDPAGERFVMYDPRQVVAFDAEGKEQWRTWTLGTRSAVFSGDGKTLFVTTVGGMVALDAATGRELATTCGWGFGRTAEETSFSVLGGPPICAEGKAPP